MTIRKKRKVLKMFSDTGVPCCGKSMTVPRVRCWCKTTVWVFFSVVINVSAFNEGKKKKTNPTPASKKTHANKTHVFQTGRKSLVPFVSQLHLFPPTVPGNMVSAIINSKN